MTRRERDIVVGFLGRVESHAALRAGLDQLRSGHAQRLVVAHATSIPVAVHNGPDVHTATRLGNPPWAQVHQLVRSFGADPDRTHCVIEHGRAAEVIARHAQNAAMIVLGHRRRPWWPLANTGRRIRDLVDVPTLRVPSVEPSSRALPAHRPTAFDLSEAGGAPARARREAS